MPSQIIHVLAGTAALHFSGISEESHQSESFNLGCQGPDLFSHNRRTKPYALAFSRLLHRREYGRCCAFLSSLLLEQPSSLLESWFYGFVSHQAIDRVFHPYIINRSYVTGATGIPGVSPSHFHAFFERILDVCVLEDIENYSVSSFDTGSSFSLSQTDLSLLAETIASALCSTYPQETEFDTEISTRVKNAFTDAIYFYKLTNPVKTTMSRVNGCVNIQPYADLGVGGVALLYPEQLEPQLDWLNSLRSPWRHPVSGELLCYSVTDLYHIAIKDASRAITAAYSVLHGDEPPESLEDVIKNGCLSVCGADGTIGAVVYFDSFDLAPVLLDQAEKRKKWLSKALLTPSSGTGMIDT